MKLAFLGTGDFGVPAIRALLNAGHEIVAVISQPDRPAGRGRAIQSTPIHATCDALGLPHVQAEDVNTPATLNLLGGVELGIVAAFGQKLGPALLAALPHGMVNIHASLLPRYRGAAPFQWAILNNDATTGVTVFRLNERWDAGAIYGQTETPIGETETADELHDRLATLGAELIGRVVSDISAGRIQPREQDMRQATRAPKLSKADGYVDWTQPAAICTRRIHGLWSWPTATALYVSSGGRSERVQLARALVADNAALPSESSPPGSFTPDRTIQTGAGRVRLLELKPAGGKLMPFDAFANGRRTSAGDRLERAPHE